MKKCPQCNGNVRDGRRHDNVHVATGFPECHRCSRCWVGHLHMKSDIPCVNEWWTLWDLINGRPVSA